MRFTCPRIDRKMQEEEGEKRGGSWRGGGRERERERERTWKQKKWSDVPKTDRQKRDGRLPQKERQQTR